MTARRAFCVAIVGAESTGKSSLATGLVERLTADTGLRCVVVGEYLREWCNAQGRTPQADEQAAIARTQAQRIAAAAATHELVLCDTTPLMTAVYSRLLFDDASLLQAALAHHHEQQDLTLLTAPDLPWVADGLQRDGAHMQAPVDALLRRLLRGSELPWAVVRGDGSARLEAALDAISPLLRQCAPQQRRAGLLTRLQQRQDALPDLGWFCQNCDQPDCEHANLQLRLAQRGGKV